MAASPLLNVQWPSIALVNVPTHLETYSNDVEITAKFTTNLCSQMLRTPTDESDEDSDENYIKSSRNVDPNRNLRRLPFETYLELVHCPLMEKGRYNKQLLSDCQVSNKKRISKIWVYPSLA